MISNRGDTDPHEALELHRKALAIRKVVLGKVHPTTTTAWSYDFLGDSLNAMERYEDALESYRTALAIREAVLGFEHT
jgi:tetratricopeptide (TPR) repeat protein